MTTEIGKHEHIICEEILNSETMKTQNEKLQDLVTKIKKFRKKTKQKAKVCCEDFEKGLYTGWTDSYKTTAKWIQEIIDDKPKPTKP